MVRIGVAQDKISMLQKMVEPLGCIAPEAWIRINTDGLFFGAITRVKSHSATIQISPQWFSYFSPYGRFYGHGCRFNITRFNHIIKFSDLDYQLLEFGFGPEGDLGAPRLRFKFFDKDGNVVQNRSLNVLEYLETKCPPMNPEIKNVLSPDDFPDTPTFEVHMNPEDFILALEHAAEKKGERHEGIKTFLLKKSGPRVVPFGKSFNCNISLCGFEAKYLRSLSPNLHVMTVRIADPDTIPILPFTLEIPLDKDSAAKLWLCFRGSKFIKQDARAGD